MRKKPFKTIIVVVMPHWLTLTEETTQIPEHLVFYIDCEKMGRDMELGGDVFTIETGYQEVHIFWNHSRKGSPCFIW